MKDKISLPGKLEVRQNPWSESPCAHCNGSPCCRNLPFVPFYMKNRSDFVNLSLLSCYNGFFPALKRSGEWIIYLNRNCRFLDSDSGKCSIHGVSHQSMICKSYDAHNCWYIDAFSKDKFTSLIPFNTEMIIWFEKRYSLMENSFNISLDWEELCNAAFEYRKNNHNFDKDHFELRSSYKLPFRKSRSDQYLFFPPYKRPETVKHFELISFRLSFPGVYLAVTDTCWAFLVKTGINQESLSKIRQEYFPGIEHKDGDFSFNKIMNEQHPYAESGEQWVVLNRTELKILRDIVKSDSSGKILRLPTSREIIDALRTQRPDKAA